MKKPPTLPEEDTKPNIPLPPGSSPSPTVIRRRILRRGRERGWVGTLLIIVLLSLIILLAGFIVLLIYTPEYFDPYIPGRLATRTAEAQIAQATAAAFATREAQFVQTQQQSANNAAATGTTVALEAVQRATQNALNVGGTASALEQTATGAAVAFEATRTAVALFAQSTADAGTRAAVERFEQRAATREAASTAIARTATAQPPREIVPQSGSETQPDTLPTLDAARFNVYFADDFEDGLDLAWTVNGDWRAENGAAFATICGTSLLVGDEAWANFAIETQVDVTTGSQFAVITGYGDGGRLYVNFGLDGTVWWLVENETGITDETVSNAYDPSQPNTIRVTVAERVVSVSVNGDVVAERLLPQAAHGRVGLYTCPANNNLPRFERFRVVRLP